MAPQVRGEGLITQTVADRLLNGSRLLDNSRVRHGMALSLVSGKHMLLVGPPGVAKTLAAEELFLALDLEPHEKHIISGYKGAGEEILVGYLDPGALERGEYRFLPGETLLNVKVCYVDEVEKLARLTQQILLQPMQSRKFSRAGIRMQLPLEALIAGGNAEPDDPAVRDRFAVQLAVDFDSAKFEQLVQWADQGGLLELQPAGDIAWDGVQMLKQAAAHKRFNAEAVQLLAEIGREFKVTPRTISEVGVPLAKAQAALDHAEEVGMEQVSEVAPYFVTRTEPLTPDAFVKAEERFGAAKRAAMHRAEYNRVVAKIRPHVQALKDLLNDGGPRATTKAVVLALRDVRKAMKLVPDPDKAEEPWDRKYKELLISMGDWQKLGLKKLGLL